MYIIHIVNYMMIMCYVFLQAGRTPLHTAAFNGHLDAVNLLLNKKPGMITKTNNVSDQGHQINFFYVLYSCLEIFQKTYTTDLSGTQDLL